MLNHCLVSMHPAWDISCWNQEPCNLLDFSYSFSWKRSASKHPPRARLAPEFFASQDEFFDANLSDRRSKTTISTTSWISKSLVSVSSNSVQEGPVQVSNSWDGRKECRLTFVATCNDVAQKNWNLVDFDIPLAKSLDLWKHAQWCFARSSTKTPNRSVLRWLRRNLCTIHLAVHLTLLPPPC